MISSLKIYFKWLNVKKEEICDPMEKILIKKELYILNYEFLKFMPFSDFYLIFKLIFMNYFYLNREKGGILVHRNPYADVARVPNVVTS